MWRRSFCLIAVILILAVTGCAQNPPPAPVAVAPVVTQDRVVVVEKPVVVEKQIVVVIEKKTPSPAPVIVQKTKIVVAKSPCAGRSQASCSGICRWVGGYSRKDGKRIRGYCRVGGAR